MPDTSAAVAAMPGNLGVPVLAPLYADGMPLAALGTALSGTGTASSGAGFWSTPPRTADDPTREVLEVSLGAARTINSVTVALPRFPHNTWLQAYDETAGAWTTLADAGGNTAVAAFTDSLPPVVAVGVDRDGRRHPAHHGAGHWVPVTFAVTPTVCSRLRLVQVRVPTAATPVTATGQAAPYPLGARDLIAGYATDTPGGTPLRPGPVASTADVLGSTVTHVLRAYDASALLTGGIWRSAPATSPSATVGLYLDCRDPLGKPQVVDRLSLDPITSGVSMCVYYARTAPQAAAAPVSNAPVSAFNASPIPPFVSGAALQLVGISRYLDVACNAVGFNPAAPWAVGIAYTPTYASTAPGPCILLDASGLRIRYAAGAITVTVGTLTATVPVLHGSGTPMVVTAAFDGTTVTATVAGATATASGSVVPGTTGVIRIGGLVGISPGAANMAVTALALWQCSPTQAAAGAAAFATSPTSVMNLPVTPRGSHPSDGIVLRLDPRNTSAANPFGLFGAPGIDTSAAVWIPLAVDAVARAGTLALPPVPAALIKIEFTNLAPLPFETATGATTATPLLDPARQSAPASSSTGTPDPGTAVLTSVGADFYSDMRRLPGPVARAVSPTEALYAPDPRVAAVVDDTPGYGFTPWQPTASAVAPRVAGQHLDSPVQSSIARRSAFGVALHGIGLGRYQAGQAPLDYERLVDLMGDTALLGPTGGPGRWALVGGLLVTPTPVGGLCQVASVPYVTHHPVVGVQFAAVCSDAAGVVPDANFTAPDLSAWTATGDVSLAIGTGYASAVGHAAAVTRSGTGGSGGIVSRATFTPGRTGRLHGAARIYAPQAASAPWQLALINGDGTVLASATATPGAGQVVEFTCSLELAVPLAPGVNHWSTYDVSSTWSTVAAHGTWGVVSGAAVWIRNVTVQLQQTGLHADQVYVDSLDMFYDPITWEVSADGGTDWFPVSWIRNDPAGVFIFPATTAAATALMWRASCDAPGVWISAVALRPWYELRQGGVRPLPPGIPAGPALSPADHFGPIEDDPLWQAWHNPVPRSWWASGRTF